MPYTPPASQSPASSSSTSPVVSRSSSYHEDLPPRSPVTARAQPPRSASYLHKHRRSPSVSSAAPPTPVDALDNMSQKTDAPDFVAMGSLRQSPPPVNNLRIPTGAVISPPDSSENSDNDENTRVERGRELQQNWLQLRQAVRAIPQQRDNSPSKSSSVQFQAESASEPVSQITSPTALTPEARKISHSRSSTETSLLLTNQPVYLQSPIQTSDDSDEDEGLFVKPSLVRKKSGELVKPALRASSRRRYSSMPGTPTYHKSVHFNDNDNQTRHFLQVDKPIAVSAGTSPVETYDSESEFPFDGDESSAKPELTIKIANFPANTFLRSTRPIRMERIFLSADKNSLVGTCAVQNIAFQKQVAVRFTLDYWKTTSEVVAEYNHDIRAPPTDGCDRFNFIIKLSDQANIASKTMLLCVRYNVGGQTYWDNNDERNFQIDFTKAVPTSGASAKPARPVPSHGLGQRPISAIPRSRHSPSRHHARPVSVDDDFATRLDQAYSYGSADSIFGGESPSASIKLKPKTKRQPLFNAIAPGQPTNGLGSRYDFGTSLSAALTTAQNTLGRSSGLMSSGPAAIASPANTGYFGPVDRNELPKNDLLPERPDALTTDRPAMGSDQYRDLVQKFCYFTPTVGKTGAPATATASVVAPTKLAAQSSAPLPLSSRATLTGPTENSASSSSDSSGSNSPMLDGAGDSRNRGQNAATRVESYAPGPASPSSTTNTRMNSRAASPGGFGYPYHLASRDGYLSDTPTPTAIHG